MNTLRVRKVGRVAKIVSSILVLILAFGNFTLDAADIEADDVEETMVATCDHDCDDHEEIYYYETDYASEATAAKSIFDEELINEYKRPSPAAGCNQHTWGPWVRDGVNKICIRHREVRYCTKCKGMSPVTRIVEGIGHAYITKKTATCTVAGTMICSRCGAVVSRAALGHAYKTVTAPTKTKTGTAKCTRCSSTKTLPKLK
jgi:hypothetical protein